MKSFFIFLIFAIFVFQSCDTSKKVVNSTSESNTIERVEKDDTQEREKILSDNGFVKATVLKKDCGFVIEDVVSKNQYFPISWLEESYKVEGNVVYVKFNTPANQNNNCPNTKSIVMEEIKLIR